MKRSALASAMFLAVACKPTGDSSVDCVAGEVGCACLPAAPGCEEGAVCFSQRCAVPSEGVLEISAADARACELLVEETSAEVAGVVFEDSVQGRFMTRGAKTAIAFFSASDAPVQGGAVRLQTVDGEPSTLTVLEAECFDREGAAVPGASIRIP